METATLTKVAICVATLHRPVGLAALLRSLAALHVPVDVRLTVVVVDNDAEASAEPVVEEWRERLPGDVVYLVESRRGIPQARNCAVAAARDAQWFAFVDDDETVDPGWLAELLRVAEEFHADVVTGAVEPLFPETPPDWVTRGRFFERPRFATGTALTYARTSNALVAGHLLTRTDTPFNEAMATSGGSDTHFFQRVRLSGGKIVWADEAIVQETIPATRVRPGWLIQRQYRRGNTRSLCLRDLEDSPGRRLKRVAAAAVHAGRGILIIISSIVRGRVALLRGAQRVAFAAGLVTGLIGRGYEEYTVVHGQ